jgi:hypothetical protein
VTTSSSTSPFIEEVPWWRRLLFERKKFVSPLPRAEVARRMGAAMDPLFSPFGSHKAQGYVKEDHAVVRRRIYYRNSFQTMAKLKFHDEGGQTRIEAQYGMALAVLMIATVVAIAVVAGAVGFFLARGPMPGPADEPVTMLPFLLFPIVFLIGFALTLLFVRSAARKDKAFLDDFIKTTLDAKDA